MTDEELIHVPVIATCRTEGCAAKGVPCALNKPTGEGTHIVVCAKCSVEITDIVPVGYHPANDLESRLRELEK